MIKRAVFLGSSLADLRRFPASVQQDMGRQINRVQKGLEPLDFKPMSSVGAGVYEVRVRDLSGAFRVLYISKFEDAVYVLHAFHKKSPKTAKIDIALAAQRYKDLVRELSR